MKIHKKSAKKISYGGKRAHKEVRYIVIHYTGNRGDTAKDNATFFAKGNTREAGAHYFVDKKGEVYKSINMNRIAYSVGGSKYADQVKKGGAKYYSVCKNSNSVSIELCDCIEDVSWTQLVRLRQLVLVIQKTCKYATNIIRHWDVNGKPCPGSMIGTDNKKWKRVHDFLTGKYTFKAQVVTKAAIRSSAKVTATNKTGTAEIGEQFQIVGMKGIWGEIKGKDSKGRTRYITMTKVKEVK
ncbi:MAG: N-acetylmuramoyl-L-alanine amidase [Lachnospiraceae bacterium]|nr:N-acetylmuramoyl-L-alanine amidase [Lachnospiraceae bacterium]